MTVDVQTAYTLGTLVAAFVAGYLHLRSRAGDTEAQAQQATRDVAVLSKEQAIATVRIAGHDVALNGGLTERIRGIVAHELLQAGIVVPVPAVPAAPPPPLAERIAAVQAQLDAAKGADHAS